MAPKTKNAVAAALSVAMPRLAINTKKTVKIGFLAPLSGKLKSWAEPGYHGCVIWKDRINARGGICLGDWRYLVEIETFDTEYNSEKAFEGIRKLVMEQDVRLVTMLGGNDFTRQVREFITRNRVLVTTLLPSDLSPDAPTLIAPSEVHPIYNVTGVDWLKRHQPHIKTAALCAQNDALGLPSVATYRAAFEAAEIEIVAEKLFPADAFNVSDIVDELMERNPDVLCWDTAYEPFVHVLTAEAYKRGFRGWMLSCTCDNYSELITKTSRQFMERFVFQFPDFDDPKLNDPCVNFVDPNAFYVEFCSRYPGTWSAVSWEYVSSLDLWKSAVERTQTFDPLSVLAMMKLGGSAKHAFGDAIWWGRDLFGIDNALVGDWPVVTIQDGHARIVEFVSITKWWSKHSALLVKHMRALDLMWDQRMEALAASPEREPRD